jgi:flagellar basal-body rod modification protein FlgD
MTTTPIGSSSSTTTSTLPTDPSKALNADDFIKMMVTQLQNQDPLQPTSNQDLLNQMSQIGQLQSTTDLQNSLKTLTLQQTLGSAGNLIGKMVTGQDDHGNPMQGMVNSVKVVSGAVSLELDNGKELSMSNVTGITQPAPTAAK